MQNEGAGYEVGYGKPPAGTKFQKGRSGNPGGRPKVTATMAQALGAALDDTLTIRVKGKRKRVTVREVIAHRLAHQAAEGNLAAIRLIQSSEATNRPSTSPVPKGDDFPEYNITLQLEEAPIKRPDFVGVVQALIHIHADVLPESFKDKCRQLVQLKKEVLAEAHLFPVPLEELTG